MKKQNLLVIAGCLWFIAGINVFALGIQALIGVEVSPWIRVAMVAGAAVIFYLFHRMFGKMVLKHSTRIMAMGDGKVSPFRAFDAKGYLIMAIMMGGGFGLRFAGLIPLWFVAFFYTGLGLALGLAGLGFLMRRFKGSRWMPHGEDSAL